MNSFRDIIAAWPDLTDFAEDLGVPENTAKQMRTRDSIPAEHWALLVEKASARGLSDISLDVLARLKAARAKRCIAA